MQSYCLKCKKNSESIDPKVSATSNGRTMILSKCTICGSKKSKFLLCVIDIYSKYAWFVPLKDKKRCKYC